MKKHLLVILIVILLILHSFLLVLINRQNKISQYSKARITLLQNHIEDSFCLDMLKINNLSGLISNNYETFNAKELYNRKIISLLLVSKAGCSSCITQQISIVENYNKKFSNNIGIVFSNETVRSIQQYKLSNKTISNLFVTQYSEELEDVIEDGPLLIDLDEDGSVLRIFRPQSEFPNLTDKFLKTRATQ